MAVQYEDSLNLAGIILQFLNSVINLFSIRIVSVASPHKGI